MRRVIIGFVLAGTFATPAYAQNFPMGRVEVHAGWDHVRGKLSYSDSDFPENNVSASENTDGVVYGTTVGIDVPVSGFYVGVEATADLASNKRCEPVFGDDRACFKVKRNFAVGGRLGIPLTHKALVYAGAAYVNGRARVSYTDDLDPSNNGAISDSRDGYRLSYGLEYRVKGNVYTKAEYRYSDYNNYSASLGSEKLSLGFDRHQVVAGVGVRF